MLSAHVSSQQPIVNSQIIETKQISDILKYCKPNSIVFLDLDNTVWESIEELGSDQWFTHLLKHGTEVIIDSEEAALYVLAVYHAVQYHAQMQLVEQDVVNIIEKLKKDNIKVWAISARGNAIIEPTLNQIKKLGIEFSSTGAPFHLKLPFGSKIDPTCQEGVIFCDGQDKGASIEAFLHYFKLSPEHVVMVDDKQRHLESVKKTIAGLNCDYVGLRYGYLDAKVAQFEMKNANAQLMQLCKKLHPPAQDALEKLQLLPNICFYKPRRTSSIASQETQDKEVKAQKRM